MQDIQDADLERRFGGLKRLYGPEQASRFAQAHIAVVGLGGVGSWAAEALARSGVQQLTLIDLDMVAESNTNRQIHALGDEYGKAKVDAMAERITTINPYCHVQCIEDFITPDNVTTLLGTRFDGVIDAIDQVKPKAAMLAYCQAQRIPIISTGAAGGKTDPTRIQQTDLAQTIQDPLLARVRTLLRKHYHFPRPPKKMGITVIYSSEAVYRPPVQCTGPESALPRQSGGSALNCAGFGSSVCVTAPMGFAAVAALLACFKASR